MTRLRLPLAVAVSAAVVLSAPFMGQLRAAMLALSRERFLWTVGAAVATAIIAAMVFALVRIRERRAVRFATIGLALAIAVAYTTIMATGYAEVDAVERVHFVEYGLIALLFYRVWRDAGDLSMIVVPLLWALVVGTLDEWLQWFIPVRVGEARDVFLNLVSIGCGLMFGVAVDPPMSCSRQRRARSMRRLGLTTAAAVLIVASFYSTVHLGHVVAADGIGRFRSRHTGAELQALMDDRAERWRTHPPTALRRLSREDQYLDEGLWHIRRRNENWDDGKFGAAWVENVILERFFTPVIDTPSYASPERNRWSPEHRRDAETRAGQLDPSFMSDAEPYPIATTPKAWFWSAIAVVVVAIAVASIRLERRRPAT